MKLIGDTHFGKKFKTGVSLNRRGELEELFYSKFEKELNEPDELVVQLGDLFDSVIVDLNTIMRVFRIIHDASFKNKNTKFIFIRGNHDAQRDSAQTSAFDILEEMCLSLVNVKFVKDTLRIENKVFIGWDYFREKTLRELLYEIGLKDGDVLFGHFEEPVDPVLLEINNDVFSGHIHKQHCVENVNFIGSLLPIAFGEENDNSFMETLSLEELLSKNPNEFINKRIRVLLKDGEELPDNINCLQLIAKRSEKQSIVLDNEIEEVDMRKLFEEELSESGLVEELYERYNDKLHSNQ